MDALLMLMVCIWRKYPGSIIMGELGGLGERSWHAIYRRSGVW
jgi:hypothetical protein